MFREKYRRESWHFTLFATAITLALILSAPPAWAQSALSTIHGTVKDEQGAAMPGVTVTISSPALQVGQIVVTSEADGNYRVGELPAGLYRIAFELAGFKSYVLSDFRLTIGFVARVDATMAVGGLEESITVTGASPVVDMTSTTTSVNLTQETLESVPVGRGLQQLFAMTPGVTTNRVDVGDSWMGVRAAAENYGQSANVKIQLDGIDIADGTSSGVYMTSLTLEEAQIRTSGNDAEVSVPGVSMVAVIKSGSNNFHGSYMGSLERPELQGSNLSDELQAQGLSETQPLKHLYDVSADLGGRIVRDKLWFYGAFVQQDKVAGEVGFAAGPGPDGRYLTGDEPLADVRTRLTHGAVKVSYQPTRSNRLIAAYQPTLKYQPQGLPPEPNRFRPLESTLDYRNPSSMYKGEFQSTLSNRMVFNVVGGYGGYLADYAPWRSDFAAPVVKGNPPRMDRETTLNLGSNPKTNLEYRDKWQVDSGLSMFPERFLGGQHELKVGTTLYWRRNSVGWRVHPAGDYTLIYDRINGVSNTPSEIQIRNSPTQPDSRAYYYAGYVKDTWRVTDRMTLNLGVRIEQQKALLPAQSKEASPQFPTLFPAQSFEAKDVLTWNTVVPRFGLAWDVANRTVLKATYGRFVNGMDDGFANAYNPMANVTMTFKWRDLNNNGDYDTGEVILDPNCCDFVQVAGQSSARLNPELRPPMTDEATLGVEREVMQNLGVRALYVYKRVTDRYTTRNVARPRSAYNIPLTRRDPGPDDVLGTSDDGGTVTIYDYDRAFFGAAFVQNEQQNTDRDDWFQTIEFTVTKRTSSKWGAMASFWAIRNHTWPNEALFDDDPNVNLNALDETWKWAGNFSGTYNAPLGIQLGAFVQSKVGILEQRRTVFRAVDPDGGPRLNQLSTVTLKVEPKGDLKTDAIHVINLRASKYFSFTSGHRVQFDFDLFNLFNSSSPITINSQSGRTFGYATAVVPPRIARVGFRYTF
jgi:hypothetical protein